MNSAFVGIFVILQPDILLKPSGPVCLQHTSIAVRIFRSTLCGVVLTRKATSG